MDQHTLLKEDMNQQANVNTEISDAQANHASFTLLRINEIEQLSNDIAAQAVDAKILLDQACIQLDDLDDSTPDVRKVASIINCFLTCAMRNVALIAEENEAVLRLTLKDGAV
ncbi:hypothetical protein [Janthinobacterium aquaticum]|uniref:hypothetical protein n=1 Tax=Janthinobacterium sp. FT58W TaxID=2654254 RepID=UPI00126509E1|nr:hypothetical protein [Janthinobacterium sp. FT58W]KAB8042580.1 hypothetical protein GCM43_13740 [Janthinobacterium sp. FT58W]